MIGTRPVQNLAPLDYRYALDASLSRMQAGKKRLFVHCNVPELFAEVSQRLPDDWMSSGPADAVLWVEPLVDNWSNELDELRAVLSNRAVLTIIASRPLAHFLPERQGLRRQTNRLCYLRRQARRLLFEWARGRGGETLPSSGPLGLRPWGLVRLCRALREAGFVVEESYGVHTMQAIFLNFLSQQVARRGYLALGDRLHFAARLRYCTTGPLAAFSTVALLVARKEQS
jgi:hypothetical protein